MTRFAKNIVIDRDATPKTNDATFVSFVVFANRLEASVMPNIVENSASAFIEAPTTSPLRMRIVRKATVDVVVPDVKPNRSVDSTIGTPVKSNFRYGSHGKGIFNPENFME